MLNLSEHFEYYYLSDHITALKQLVNWESYFDMDNPMDAIFFDNDETKPCVSLKLGKENETHQCFINSSYYIGLDRFLKFNLPVYIQPKVNNEDQQLNYIGMLFEALKEPENFEHLDGLLKVRFDEQWIEIENQLQPILTPFLIVQFLAVVKSLIKKGLKQSYYNKTENLHGRVKGKVLVGRQIKDNIFKNRITKTICQYQEFGVDTEVNQFLKYAVQILPRNFEDFDIKGDIRKNLEEVWRFCQAGFQQVSHQSFTNLSFKERNPFYKQYNLAIQLANQIIALQDFNISKTSNKQTSQHPPFWIDMSKLFELYVFKKLRETFKGENEVVYHHKVYQQELDFIINTGDFKAVVDAKYKPRYASGNPSMEDARQLSGYTRLNKVYNELKIDSDELIPAYFVYPSNLPAVIEKEKHNDVENFEETALKAMQLLSGPFRKSSMYKQMYLQEIALPINY